MADLGVGMVQCMGNDSSAPHRVDYQWERGLWQCLEQIEYLLFNVRSRGFPTDETATLLMASQAV